MTDWCILRTVGSCTLRLAESLSEAGFDVWTPQGPVKVRKGPFRSRREIRTPLMPTFVFARADRLTDLLTITRSPSLLFQVWDAEQRRMVTKGHPPFRLFRNGNHRPIPDSDLASLRRAEKKRKDKRGAYVFKTGDRVRTNDGGFEGITGVVVGVSGKMVAVQFPRWPIVPKFAAHLLRPMLDDEPVVHIQPAMSEQALSAKAA